MVTVQAAIEVRAIGQRARSSEEVTLRDVSLTVGHGELVAIIGGSGSGKTTLLDAMSGLRPPSSGTVARSTGRSAHAGRYAGYIPNADTIAPGAVAGPGAPYTAALRAGEGLGGGAAAEALRAVDLAGQAATRAGRLDAGQRKRAAIAVELLAEPSQLFLEEPTIGLDPAQGAEVMRRLRRLCESGVTVVLTTQNPLDAVRCDKVAVLATGGHLAFFGAPAAACDYFAADSLDEIYERLAGLGDPAAAWSRRFPQFSRTVPGFTASPDRSAATRAGPSAARHGGPALGRPGVHRTAGGAARRRAVAAELSRPGCGLDADLDADLDEAWLAGWAASSRPARPTRAARHADAAGPVIRPVRQWPVLTRRNVDVLVRSRPTLAALAGAPVAVLLALLVLLGLRGVRPGAAGRVVLDGVRRVLRRAGVRPAADPARARDAPGGALQRPQPRRVRAGQGGRAGPAAGRRGRRDPARARPVGATGRRRVRPGLRDRAAVIGGRARPRPAAVGGGARAAAAR